MVVKQVNICDICKQEMDHVNGIFEKWDHRVLHFCVKDTNRIREFILKLKKEAGRLNGK